MVDATRVGLPASLEKCAEVLEVDAQKDNKGKALIRYFSVPCKPTKQMVVEHVTYLNMTVRNGGTL